MIYFHKVLPTLILPLMLSIILIILGIIKNRKKALYCVLLNLYLISTPIFSNYFFSLIEGEDIKTPIRNIRKSDAIVVLSGMLEVQNTKNYPNIEWGDPDRFSVG
jgi:hypothetical protein